ncbi:MAG TPA: phenylalanine--tRNA ligase subunit beta [Vicinamibacterales bacterium]
MRLLVSWLRDFVDIDAPAEEIAERVGLRGFEVASIEAVGDGDAVIDFEVTANRPDCLSVLGLAREVATIYNLPLRPPSSSAGATILLKSLPIGASDHLTVTIEDADLCPRYAAAVADVSVGTSPAWMTRRLQAAGLRPISTIVDLTNYVLVELGHPMHAFDLAKLAGPEIRVRRAKPGEVMTTLDGVQRTLDPEMLVIADRDRAQAIAGVMGGAGSEVSSSTRRVVFESAYFKPASVRRTGKRLNLKTEASARFERGADIGAPVFALQRLAALMDQINSGQTVGPIIDVYPGPRQAAPLHLRRSRLAALLGVTVPDPDVERILHSLGIAVTTAPEGWDAVVPTFRVDLVREVDLIEEVGRHYGFDKLAATFPVVTAPAPPPDARIPRDQLVRRVLTAAGLSEAVTFGFIEAKAAQAFAAAGSQPVALANPLSAKFDTLRPSLIPGLVDAVAHNRRHGRDNVRLFEIGTRFATEGETRAVAVAWTGSVAPLHWSAGGRPVDFFDVKGLVEGLSHALDVPLRFEPATEPFLAPGQTAAILCAGGAAGGSTVGLAGQVAPDVADARGLSPKDRVYVAELNLDLLDRARVASSDATQSLPRYPFVVRDLSIVVSDTLPAEIIRGTIQAAGRDAPAPLTAVAFFDRYQGKGVPEGAVSISVRLTFQAADRTLTDAEVQQSVEKILTALIHEHRAVQR